MTTATEVVFRDAGGARLGGWPLIGPRIRLKPSVAVAPEVAHGAPELDDGLNSCWLLTEPVISLPFTSNGVGLATIRIRLVEPSLVGADLFAQFTVLDRSANALGATFSNGVRMRVGG